MAIFANRFHFFHKLGNYRAHSESRSRLTLSYAMLDSCKAAMRRLKIHSPAHNGNWPDRLFQATNFSILTEQLFMDSFFFAYPATFHNTVNHLIFVCSFILSTYFLRLKFMTHDVFLCKFYMCKCFMRTLNLHTFKFMKCSRKKKWTYSNASRLAAKKKAFLKLFISTYASQCFE